MNQPSNPNPRDAGFSTLCVHAGEDRQKLGDAITDPIFCASTYTFPDTQSVIDFIEQKQPREEYGRYGNPSEKVVERKLAALEGGEAALLFSTGMAAIVGLLMAKLNAGDEVIFFDECYHRSREFCTKHLAASAWSRGRCRPATTRRWKPPSRPRTQLLISESPTNPHLSVVDLERFVDIGRRHGVETLIDATLGTPYNIRPLAAGVDYVLHSATKYLAGHNDLLAGVIIGSGRKARAGPQAPRHHGQHQLAAQHLSAGARPENVRAADAAAQRKRPGRGRVSGQPSADRKGLLPGPARRIPITRWPGERCAALAAW